MSRLSFELEFARAATSGAGDASEMLARLRRHCPVVSARVRGVT